MSEIGLHISSSETSFVINLDSDFEIIENNLVGDAYFTRVLYDLFSCFSTRPANIANITTCEIEGYLKYDISIKNKIESFIAKYKDSYPQINNFEKHIQKLILGEYICVFPSNIFPDTEQMWAIQQELNRLNGQQELPPVPLLAEYNSHTFGKTTHTNIGHQDKKSRKCRWCGKTIAAGATFNKKAHAITEALGNKNVILLDECDCCNEKFGKTIEKSIVSFFSLFNTIFGIKGKKGVPKIKDSKIQLSLEHTENEVMIQVREDDIKFDNGRPESIFVNIPERVRLQDVYRSLCKYALGTIEEEGILSDFSEAIKWINGEIVWDKTPLVKILTNRVFCENPTINIYVRKTGNREYPRMFAEFRYAFFVIVYIVPTSTKEKTKFLKSENYAKFWDLTFYKDVLGWIDWDFSSNSKKLLRYKINFQRVTR